MTYRFVLSLLTIAIATGTPAAERLSNGYTQPDNAFFRAGFWWSEDNPGFGLDLHPAGEQIVGIWATYDDAGQATWYFGTGTRSGEVWRMPLTRYSQAETGVLSSEAAGEIELEFSSGYAAEMRWELGSRTGREAIAPLIATDQPAALDQTGFWYQPSRSGYGYSIATQGNVLLSVLYYYDAAGQPRWAWGDNIALPAGEPLTLLAFTGRCPGCDEVAPEFSFAGTLRLNFLSETIGVADAQLELESGDWVTGPTPIAQLTDRPSGRSSDADMAPLTNETLLSAWFDNANSAYPQIYSTPDVNFSPAISVPLADVSTTNLQVAGVDEADVVKTDGTHLYVLQQPSDGTPRLRILSLGDAPRDIAEVASVALDLGGLRASGLYLTGTGAERQVTVVASPDVFYGNPLDWFLPEPWIEGITRIVAFNVADRANPQPVATLEFDGQLLESRVIDDTLYVVSRSQPLAGSELTERLPQLRRGVTRQPLVTPDRVLLPPVAPGYYYPDLVSVSAFALKDLAADPATLTYLGLAATVYVSQKNLYLASSRWGYSFAPVLADVIPRNYSSDIHRFALSEGAVSYAGSGTVEGFVGTNRLNPSFALGEADGQLRVISSGDWDELGEHRVSVLRLDPAALTVTGFAPNARRPERLGKPGEQLFGVRFVGNRLYAVTFKNIDPLYVVNLDDPADPFIAGALEIPGFSDYLHPLPGDLLVGVGKNAVDASGPGDGNFAWYQGLQLSLFDVADPAQPTLLNRVDIGRRGSESSLLRDHHAFALLPGTDERTPRITVPLVVHDAKDGEEISADPTWFYDYRYTGLGMFEVTGGGADARLELKDVLITHTAEADPDRDPWLDAAGRAGRGVISEESALFILHGEVYSSAWGNAEVVNGPY
ncbi:MAG: beta-propeller domain-containing protein [Pseudomonadota bacterium]